MFQALNAVLSGSSRGLVNSLSRVANSAEDAGEAALQGALGFARLEENAGDVATDTAQAAAATAAFQSQLDEVSGDALTGSIALKQYRDTVDDVGDEATGTAVETGLLSGALATVTGAASSAVGPLSGARALVGSLGTGSVTTAAATSTFAVALDGLGLSAAAAGGGILTLESSMLPLLVVIGAVVVAIGGLVAALGGLTVAAGAAAGAMSALFLGGLIPAARDLAETSEDIESTWEGLQAIFGQVRDAALKAVEPLVGVEGFETIAFSALEQGIVTLNMAAESMASLGGVLRPLARQFGAVFAAVRPQVIGELEQSVRQFAPMLADFATGALRSLPGVLRVLRDSAAELGPDIGSLFESLGGVLPEAISLLVDATRLVLPPLTFFLELLDVLLSIAAPVVNSLNPLLEFFGQFFDMLTFGLRVIEAMIDAVGRLVKTFVAGFSDGPLGGIISQVESLTKMLKGGAQSYIAQMNAAETPGEVFGVASEGIEPTDSPYEAARSESGEGLSDSGDETVIDMSSATFVGGDRREAKRTADEVEKVVERVLERKRIRQSGSK
jgi:hypothetical protein